MARNIFTLINDKYLLDEEATLRNFWADNGY